MSAVMRVASRTVPALGALAIAVLPLAVWLASGWQAGLVWLLIAVVALPVWMLLVGRIASLFGAAKDYRDWIVGEQAES